METEGSRLEGIGKVQTGSLRKQVYEKIKDLILSNRLPPGQDLTMDQIATEMGVSHTPIREALAMLELDGLVVMARHKTPQVCPISPVDVQEVYEMRALLEGCAAKEAAGSVTDQEINIVKEKLAHARREAGQGRFEASMDADLYLHGLMVSIVENSLFQKLYQFVENQSIRIRTLVEARSPGRIDLILDEHDAIVAALQARDPELTQTSVASHLELAMERTLAALQTIDEKGDIPAI